jgi:hypothetical protein
MANTNNTVDKSFSRALVEGDSPFTITESMGIKAFSLQGTSDTAVTIIGTETLGGLASGAISLTETDPSFNVQTVNSNVLGAWTITIPSGATANFVALI